MSPTVKRLAVLVALSTTLGVVAPVAGASAAGTPLAPDSLPGDAGVSGQVIVGPALVGPVVITKAPSSFVNTNNQDSLGGNGAGMQVAAP
jgi:hypothetical protein